MPKITNWSPIETKFDTKKAWKHDNIKAVLRVNWVGSKNRVEIKERNAKRYKNIGNFKTKEKAMNFARNWMKKHSGGEWRVQSSSSRLPKYINDETGTKLTIRPPKNGSSISLRGSNYSGVKTISYSGGMNSGRNKAVMYMLNNPKA